MISLYHFTSRNNIDHLVKGNTLKKGSIKGQDGLVLKDAAVSLTDDTDPVGHGLPDGRVVTESQARKLNGISIEKGNIYRCVDHTKYRMRIEFDPKDTLLVKAVDYYKNYPAVLKILEETAYYPIDNIVPPVEAQKIKTQIEEGRFKRKGPTWWYYFGDIDLSNWIDISVRLDDGNWHDLGKSDFLKVLAELNAERDQK